MLSRTATELDWPIAQVVSYLDAIRDLRESTVICMLEMIGLMAIPTGGAPRPHREARAAAFSLASRIGPRHTGP